MKTTVLSICAAAILLLPAMASAETQDYDWSFSANSGAISGSGILTVDLDLTGTGPDFQLGYEIISLTGTVNGDSVSLVPTNCGSGPSPCLDGPDGSPQNPTPTVPGINFDNLFFDPLTSDGSHVDFNGIDFASLTTNYNIYSAPDDGIQVGLGDGAQVFGLDANFEATSSTPEPASFLLIAGGIAGIAFVRRRRLI